VPLGNAEGSEGIFSASNSVFNRLSMSPPLTNIEPGLCGHSRSTSSSATAQWGEREAVNWLDDRERAIRGRNLNPISVIRKWPKAPERRKLLMKMASQGVLVRRLCV
jgi:hypothetical protein